MKNLTRTQKLLKLPLVLAVSAAALSSMQVSAHGYVESPKSRSFMCNAEGGLLNANCGSVQFEPQSVEYIGRADGSSGNHYPSSSQACTGDFTKCGPANGTIAAGGHSAFAALNEQTATRWTKTTIKPGPQTFTWLYKAAHATRYWQFYITKKDWNPNQPLTRDSFEMKPLLDEQWPALNAPTSAGGKTKHTVNIPSDRSGYHVMLATWKVHDTDATFYQVIDLNIDNGAVPASPWTNVGVVNPEQLKVGDKVKTRVFSTSNEIPSKQVVLDINSANLAKADIWPHELAVKVNAAKQGYLMGQLNAQNEVVPGYGKNDIVVSKGSNINSVIIEKVQAMVPGELTLSGLQPQYTLHEGKAEVHFSAIVKGEGYKVKATVHNNKNETVAFQEAAPGNNPHFAFNLTNQQAGDFSVSVVASKKDDLLQQSANFKLVAEDSGNNAGGGEPGAGQGSYDYVFPQSLSSYKAGTIVMQPRDGHRYQCKPFPYSGYCVQWNQGSTAFEPGIGHSWQMAWNRL